VISPAISAARTRKTTRPSCGGWPAEARPGDTVLLMGARDPELPGLARRVFAALA